jgi:ABC-2 type transport system permease protein
MTTTATTVPGPAAGHYRLPQAARMEWIKLRSLRSTWWTLALTAAAAIGIGVAVGLNTRNAAGDLTNNALAGVSVGLLLTGALGVLTMTSEFSSGMIRATFAAIPRRPVVLAAKTAVFSVLTLALGEVASFIAFFAGGASLRHGIAAPTLSQPGVLRAVILTGAGYCLIGLIGLGLGAVIRHTGAAIAVLVGGVYVIAQFIAMAAHSLLAYLPISIVANSLGTTKPETCGHAQCPHILSAWAGLGMLAVYAAVLLVIGGLILAKRDA